MTPEDAALVARLRERCTQACQYEDPRDICSHCDAAARIETLAREREELADLVQRWVEIVDDYKAQQDVDRAALATALRERDTIATQTWEQAARVLQPALEADWLDDMDRMIQAMQREFRERAAALRPQEPTT